MDSIFSHQSWEMCFMYWIIHLPFLLDFAFSLKYFIVQVIKKVTAGTSSESQVFCWI